MSIREQFETWFRKRWPEFEHSTAPAFEIWQASRSEALEEVAQMFNALGKNLSAAQVRALAAPQEDK